MAQTITTVRGTTTCGHNSSATLYTQSGGSASRVIFGYISYYTSSYIGNPYVAITHNSSGAGTGLIGYSFYNSGSRYGGVLMPSNNTSGPIQTIGTSGAQVLANGALTVTDPNYSGSMNPQNISPRAANNFEYSYLPSNYWIGPSDSIVFRWYENNAYTANVAYAMTIITES